MTEIVIKVDIPSELKEEIGESYKELSKLVRELIIAKGFEIQLARSKALQRALLETLIAKSKLTERSAKEFASEIDEGMFKKLKEEFPVL